MYVIVSCCGVNSTDSLLKLLTTGTFGELVTPYLHEQLIQMQNPHHSGAFPSSPASVVTCERYEKVQVDYTLHLKPTCYQNSMFQSQQTPLRSVIYLRGKQKLFGSWFLKFQPMVTWLHCLWAWGWKEHYSREPVVEESCLLHKGLGRKEREKQGLRSQNSFHRHICSNLKSICQDELY